MSLVPGKCRYHIHRRRFTTKCFCMYRCQNNFPNKICVTCYEIVNKAIEFRDTVTKNDSILKSLHDNTANEDIIEYRIVIKDEDVESDTEAESNCCAQEIHIENSESNDNSTYSCIVNLTSNSTPLGSLTIRKDLFPNSVQEKQKENIVCEEKEKIKKSKNHKDVIQDECEETHEDKIDCKNKVEKKPKCEETDIIIYKCRECTKSFKTWRKLYHHTRQHNKTKACPIKECGKMFYSKSDLEKHIRIHTGVRPYQCNLCDKSFTQKSTLNSHKDAVH
ncbi:PREDICTED: zinc finger protein 891-like isoform X2 [Papilio xuthus]|uniref:Zinc finger protein 891-like isoform X2 n=1 Tax=Papilio xuthus TaxID=66420 RepID=A0AAJ6Z9B2_PAPXU|nr:PREDICTED: zinc finger protein 891-like isoform X2 [Papilio xuthus]